MNTLGQILTLGTLLLAIYALVVIALLLQTIVKHRDALYRAKYEEFRRQKDHVLDQLEQGRKRMPNTDITIRDFIYVDADRLYSLYSQVFEGVAEQIVESVIAGLTTTDSQKGPPLQGSSTEAQVAEATRRTENKSLYDHMYNRLERRLGTAIIGASEIRANNYKEKLEDAFMVRVSGTAEIEDYARLETFMERFNELGEAIGYSQLIAMRSLAEATWKEQEHTIQEIKDRNQRKSALKQLEKQKKDFELQVKASLEESGLRQDETMLSNLRLFIEIFNSQGFDITISPDTGDGSVVYRGIIDKKWLRIQPDFLRALYGGIVRPKWTMVGKVTYIPRQDEVNELESEEPGKHPFSDKVDSEQQLQDIQALENAGMGTTVGDKEPSMRDPFRNMFRATRAFEEMFLESKERVEILVAPLAVYHEVVVSDTQAEE